jgi:hypothetical protein
LPNSAGRYTVDPSLSGAANPLANVAPEQANWWRVAPKYSAILLP